LYISPPYSALHTYCERYNAYNYWHATPLLPLGRGATGWRLDGITWRDNALSRHADAHISNTNIRANTDACATLTLPYSHYTRQRPDGFKRGMERHRYGGFRIGYSDLALPAHIFVRNSMRRSYAG